MPSWHSTQGGAAESVFLCLHGVGQHKTALKADLCVLLCPVMLQEHCACSSVWCFVWEECCHMGTFQVMGAPELGR